MLAAQTRFWHANLFHREQRTAEGDAMVSVTG